MRAPPPSSSFESYHRESHRRFVPGAKLQNNKQVERHKPNKKRKKRPIRTDWRCHVEPFKHTPISARCIGKHQKERTNGKTGVVCATALDRLYLDLVRAKFFLFFCFSKANGPTAMTTSTTHATLFIFAIWISFFSAGRSCSRLSLAIAFACCLFYACARHL